MNYSVATHRFSVLRVAVCFFMRWGGTDCSFLGQHDPTFLGLWLSAYLSFFFLAIVIKLKYRLYNRTAFWSIEHTYLSSKFFRITSEDVLPLKELLSLPFLSSVFVLIKRLKYFVSSASSTSLSYSHEASKFLVSRASHFAGVRLL